LERASPFADLKSEERQLLAEHLHLQHFAAGEIVFSEDAASNALYLIKHGGVRLSYGPVTLATLGVGAIFGENDVFLARKRTISAQATGETDVWALSAHDLEQIVSANPTIGIQLSRSFGTRLAQLEPYLVGQRLRTAPGLEALSDDERSRIAANLDVEIFHAGRTLFREGNQPDALYIVESGAARIQRDELLKEGQGADQTIPYSLADRARAKGTATVSRTPEATRASGPPGLWLVPRHDAARRSWTLAETTVPAEQTGRFAGSYDLQRSARDADAALAALPERSRGALDRRTVAGRISRITACQKRIWARLGVAFRARRAPGAAVEALALNQA